ncbi:MAG: AAA family ATPase, partial [Candidatus Aenigmatarchaeota archaeon]
PNVKWEDIGGLDETKEMLKEIIEWPLKSPKSFETMGIKPPTGVLFYGPPGCGKTMIAKAVANEAGANFISIRGPEITSKWVGESEKHIREIFKRAKQVAPTIIFFDEIDSIATSRGGDSGSRAYENVVSQILVEMSGIEELRNVIVIAATNRPDIIDSALLRSGRLERQLLIPAPDQKSRERILQIHTRNMPVEKDINIKKLAEKTEGYTGADLEALIREAGMTALRRTKMKGKTVSKKDFDAALTKIRPSLNAKVMEFYNKVDEILRAPVRKEKEKEVEYVG